MTNTTNTKRCPFCAEEILDVAVKCKHCGSMLTPQAPTVAPHVQTTSAGMPWKVAGLIGCGLGVATCAVTTNPAYDNEMAKVAGGIAIAVGFLLFIVGRAQD